MKHNGRRTTNRSAEHSPVSYVSWGITLGVIGGCYALMGIWLVTQSSPRHTNAAILFAVGAVLAFLLALRQVLVLLQPELYTLLLSAPGTKFRATEKGSPKTARGTEGLTRHFEDGSATLGSATLLLVAVILGSCGPVFLFMGPPTIVAKSFGIATIVVMLTLAGVCAYNIRHAGQWPWRNWNLTLPKLKKVPVRSNASPEIPGNAFVDMLDRL